MAAAVGSAHDKRGLATVVLQELTRRAHEAGLVRVIAPLRPAWKHRYPTVPMGEYAAWTRSTLVSIDRERDRGVHVEQNLWVQHC